MSLWRRNARPMRMCSSLPGPSCQQCRCRSNRAEVVALPSTVARGTSYEYACLLFLARRFGMRLGRVGGAGDRGIDLIGWWWLPAPAATPGTPVSLTPSPEQPISRRLRIIAQCKAQSSKLGPSVVRELEGSIRAQKDGPSTGVTLSPLKRAEVGGQNDILGILFSSHGFSKQSSLQCLASNTPILLVHLAAPPFSDSDYGPLQDASPSSSLDESSLPSDPPCLAAVGNAALLGRQGPLDGRLELRWAVDPSAPRVTSDDGISSAAGMPLFYWDRRRLTQKKAEKLFKAPDVEEC